MTKLSINLNKIARCSETPEEWISRRSWILPNSVSSTALTASPCTPDPISDTQLTGTYSNSQSSVRITLMLSLNVEGYPTFDFLKVVKSAKPDQCTLVPDAPDQITSDHGWNTITECVILFPILADLKQHDIRTQHLFGPRYRIDSVCGQDRRRQNRTLYRRVCTDLRNGSK